MSPLLAADLDVIGWALIHDVGHLECGAWSFDPATGELACACGATVFRLEPVS